MYGERDRVGGEGRTRAGASRTLPRRMPVDNSSNATLDPSPCADQMRIVKQRLLEMIVDLSIFLDAS